MINTNLNDNVGAVRVAVLAPAVRGVDAPLAVPQVVLIADAAFHGLLLLLRAHDLLPALVTTHSLAHRVGTVNSVQRAPDGCTKKRSLGGVLLEFSSVQFRKSRLNFSSSCLFRFVLLLFFFFFSSVQEVHTVSVLSGPVQEVMF